MADQNPAVVAVADAISRTIGAVDSHGPRAVELAGQYLHITAITSFIIYLIFGSILLGSFCWACKKYWFSTNVNKSEKEKDVAVIITALAGIFLAFPGIMVIGSAFNPALIAAMLSPEMALMQKALSLIH